MFFSTVSLTTRREMSGPPSHTFTRPRRTFSALRFATATLHSTAERRGLLFCFAAQARLCFLSELAHFPVVARRQNCTNAARTWRRRRVWENERVSLFYLQKRRVCESAHGESHLPPTQTARKVKLTSIARGASRRRAGVASFLPPPPPPFLPLRRRRRFPSRS